MNSVQLMQGDCCNILPNLHDSSVDMVFCDLPYGTTDCKWDSVIDIHWLFSEYFRIVKKNGAIVVTASQPFTSQLVYANQKSFKHEWIWKKNAGSNFGTVKFQPMKEHESVLIFSNGGGKVPYNPIMQERAESGKSRVKTPVKYNGKPEVYGNGALEAMVSTRPDLRYPSSVQNFNRERGLHPTQKPVDLVEYMVRTYSNAGDVILDNCMGSGTTGVACINTNRKFIGIEMDEKYFNIASKRIEDAQRKLNEH